MMKESGKQVHLREASKTRSFAKRSMDWMDTDGPPGVAVGQTGFLSAVTGVAGLELTVKSGVSVGATVAVAIAFAATEGTTATACGGSVRKVLNA
jgi:hypothetical protein